MNEPRKQPASTDQLPRARRVRNWKTHLFWLVPIGAALLAGWFIYYDLISRGPTLHISFDDAQELQPGKSEVRFRGAQIGLVKKILLSKDNKHVEITVSLDGSAKNVARQGSQFWIVRPHLGVEEIKAARTIVSGNYVTVEPGTGKPQTEFNGLSAEPIIEPPGDLNIMLIAEKLGSVKPRTPVFYRGFQVGEVRLVDLGPTSQTVRIMVQIKQHFVPLVRMNSKFWNAGGINFNVSFSGLDISSQSAQTLLSGGIAFATPDVAGQQALPGTSYRLYDKPEEAWLAWAPSISLNPTNDMPQQTGNGPSTANISSRP